jgi:hypothetical protein
VLRALRRWWRRTGTPPAGAAGATEPPDVHDVTQTHEEVSDYWTDERMRSAQPREQQRPVPGTPPDGG